MPNRIDCDIEQLRGLYFDQRMSCAEVADAIGLGRKRMHLVWRKLRDAGYVMRPAGGRKRPWPAEEMRRLYVEEECNAEEVAACVGCSATHARRILNKLGVMRPRGASTKNRRGTMAPRWNGGRRVDEKGYVFLWMPDHPQAHKSGYVAEHRMIASDVLGVHLTPKDEVHHINGVHGDNRPENLMVVRKGAHQRMHADICRELWKLRQEVAALRTHDKSNPVGAAGAKHGDNWRIVG